MSDAVALGASEPCQHCEDEPQETAVSVAVGGLPLGLLFVCTDCEQTLTADHSAGATHE